MIKILNCIAKILIENSKNGKWSGFWNVPIFLSFGVPLFNLRYLFSVLIPVSSLTMNFIPCFLIFYLFIPFINKLVSAINHRDYLVLLLLCLGIHSLWASIPWVMFSLNYVSWFMVVYLLGAYIRLYPNRFFDNISLTCISMICCISVSWLTVPFWGYYFVADSNKIMAILTAFSIFLFFKNWQIPHSRIINTLATATFGILLIHDNSYVMRFWLWKCFFKSVQDYYSHNFVIHSIVTVITVYVFCALIELLRLRLIEQPLFRILKNRSTKHNP